MTEPETWVSIDPKDVLFTWTPTGLADVKVRQRAINAPGWETFKSFHPKPNSDRGDHANANRPLP